MSDGKATATKAAAPDPLIGRVVADRFTITSLIARGGMGKVYRAEQAPLGRACALKVLNPNYVGDADPEFHRRFYREASVSSKINHPNSVTIFDYGKTDDEIYYIAMEYLEGQTLHQAIREQKTLPEERAGRIAAQICRALREAHALGVIHRDLKPANIFLTRHGDDGDFVKVLDFGLVKHLSERPEEQLTQTGLFMGSPKYMAPEQIQGGQVDERTDIYSLGIILYEMLAGKVPFDRPTSVNILMAHVGEPPPPMREVNPNLVCTPQFEELVMRCIAKDPAQRFSTMDEVLQALKLLHGVSMTGQLAAVSMSGPYASMMPPPAVTPSPGGVPSREMLAAHASQSMRVQAQASSQHAVASGQQTQMGMLRSGVSDQLAASEMDVRPRPRVWIAVGILAAAVIGGGLGKLAFEFSAPSRKAAVEAKPAPVAPAEKATPAESAAADPASARAPATASAAETATLHVTSQPPGATVQDETGERCPATPCDLTYEGGAAAPSRKHELSIRKTGYHGETRVVRTSEGTVHFSLVARASGGARPSAPRAKPTSTQTSTTSQPGFKETPY